MKSLKFFILIVLSIALAMPSCKKKDEEEDDPPMLKLFGWAVGGMSNSYGLVMKTSDGGNSWFRQGDSIQLPASGFSDVCILDTSNVIIVGDSIPGRAGHNVYRSVDGGINWNRSGAGLPNVNYGGTFAWDYNNIWIVGDHGTIYYSNDGGFSWARKEVPGEYNQDIFLRVVAASPTDIWVVGDQHPADSFPVMLHSNDKGENWERHNPIKDLNMMQAKQGHFLSIKIKNNVIWAIGGSGKFIIRSADGGITWQDVSVNPSLGDANDIYPISGEKAYVVEDYGEFYYTMDGGQNYTQYNTGTNDWLTGIAVLFDYKVWICGNPGGSFENSVIKYSPDGGKTWLDQTPQFMKDDMALSAYKIRMMAVYN